MSVIIFAKLSSSLTTGYITYLHEESRNDKAKHKSTNQQN